MRLKGRGNPDQYWVYRAGFTLIELIVTLVLLAVVAVLATRVLSTSLDMWITTEDYAEERADQVAALERMVREVRQAKKVDCRDQDKGDDIERLWLKRQNNEEREFEVEVCRDCSKDSYYLLYLSLSEDINTYVYPRNADCP